MEVSVQTANSGHLRGIHDLVLEWGYQASEPETLDWLEALVDSSTHQIFVAVSADSVLGWIGVEKRISLGHPFIAEITGLVVSSSYRRSGTGQLLVEAVEEWSKNLGLSSVLVRSNVSRLASHEFYPSIGFKLKKTTHVYVKELDGPNEIRRVDQ